MSDDLIVTIAGEPVAKGRPRFNTKTGHAYTPDATKSAERLIAWHIKEAAQAQGFSLPVTGKVHVAFGFGTRHNKRGNVNRASDLDNYVKLCLDAMNGVVFLDDVQVVYLAASIDREADDAWTSIRLCEETA